MPYCRRCGTELSENARFCQKCGTPVESYMQPPQATPTYSTRPMHRDPLVLITFGVIAIILVAAIVSVVAFAPIYGVSFNQTEQDTNPNVNTLNLNFQCDAAQINIMTENLNSQNILINVSSEGKRSIFAPENSFGFTFTNETANGVLTVNAKVTQAGLSYTADLVCNIFVNPTLKLNLNVTSTTGQVSFTGGSAATIESLYLKATTGVVQANLDGNVTVAGDISLITQTGQTLFRMNQADIQGNRTINLQSTTGSVGMDITEDKVFDGNLQVNAASTTGAINVDLQIDGDVAAKITSQVQTGNVNADAKNFSGNKSPLQSNNYPSQSNIIINNIISGYGDVNISASYASSVSNIRN